MFRVVLTVAIFLTSFAVCHAGDANKGEDIAIEHCRRCHVIPGQNNMGIGITPSFKAMIQSKAADWRHKFEVFYALRPHPSFVIIREFRTTPEFPLGITPVVIAVDDLDHLMAYVDKLAQDFRK
ncbi:hypothetical protein [Anderseniella sp. Alg231-50]|uniref:hypothetical protein n=1 Tax=Anderseniella sp. Alg231-50 TaxID=1922226 RepID=UPI000D561CCA